MNNTIKSLVNVNADELVAWLRAEVGEAVVTADAAHYRDKLLDVLGIACHLLARHSEDTVRETILWWAASYPLQPGLSSFASNIDALDLALISYEIAGPEAMVRRSTAASGDGTDLQVLNPRLTAHANRLAAARDIDQHLNGLVHVISISLKALMCFGDKAMRESLASWCDKQQSRQRDIRLLDDVAALNSVLRSCGG